MDKYEKILVFFLISYFLLLVYRLDHRNFLWDETYVNAPVVFWRDFISHFIKNATLDLNKLKSYGLNYQSHYIFFSQMMWHPPFYKILVFLSTLLFGINEFAARFPSVIFGVLGLFFTYVIGKELTNKKSIALLSTIILALSPLYYQFSRISTPDMAVAVMITITMFFLLRYLKYKKRRDSVLFGLLFGLSLLTKEFALSIAFSLLLFILFRKKYSLLKDLNIYLAGFLVFTMFVPWILFSNIFPVLLDIPYVSIQKYTTHIKFNISPFDLLVFHNKQFSYIIGFLTIFGLVEFFRKKEDSNLFLLSWFLPSYFLPMVFISSSSTEFYRFSMPIMPVLAISTSIFLYRILNYSRKKNYRKILINVMYSLLFIAFILSLNYNIKVQIRYPVEKAVLWVIENTPKNGGVLYDDKGMQFYFMKHDRNLTFRTSEVTSQGELKSFLDKNYSKLEYEKFGIENPRFYYIIVKEPLDQSQFLLEKIGKKDIYNREQTFFKEFFDHINQDNINFKLKKVFFGNKPNTNVFIFEIIEQK